VVAGAVVLTFANYWLLPDVIQRLPLGGADMSQFSYGIYGFLLVAVMLVRPRGLWPRYWPRPVLGSRDGSRRMPAGRWSVLTKTHSGSVSEP
jgi:hypothetical protein